MVRGNNISTFIPFKVVGKETVELARIARSEPIYKAESRVNDYYRKKY